MREKEETTTFHLQSYDHILASGRDVYGQIEEIAMQNLFRIPSESLLFPWQTKLPFHLKSMEIDLFSLTLFNQNVRRILNDPRFCKFQ